MWQQVNRWSKLETRLCPFDLPLKGHFDNDKRMGSSLAGGWRGLFINLLMSVLDNVEAQGTMTMTPRNFEHHVGSWDPRSWQTESL